MRVRRVEMPGAIADADQIRARARERLRKSTSFFVATSTDGLHLDLDCAIADGEKPTYSRAFLRTLRERIDEMLTELSA